MAGNICPLRPGYFYINLLHSIPLITKAGILGNNYSSDTGLVLVHPGDIAVEVAGAVLGKAINMPELKHVALSSIYFMAPWAAASMTAETALGWEMNTTWLPFISVTVAPARFAINRSLSGESS